MIRLRLLEFAVDVGPAACEHDARPVARAGAWVAVHRRRSCRCSSPTRSLKVAALLSSRMRWTTTPGAVRHHICHGLAPCLEPRPAGLVETDHRLRQHVLRARADGIRAAARPRRADPTASATSRPGRARHDPRLPLERDVVEVLVDDDLDRDVERVAAPPATARSGPGAVSTQPPHRHTYFCCLTLTTR